MLTSPDLRRFYRYSGLIREDDPFHTPIPIDVPEAVAAAPEGTPDVGGLFEAVTVITPPLYVIVGRMKIPQWAPTAASLVRGFNPAKDCNGNFMSSKYQANNNCYNYACNIATNSFAQPGRRHGIPVRKAGLVDTGNVIDGAIKDGLIFMGRNSLPMSELVGHRPSVPGHFVALLIADPDGPAQYEGDFHWVRCDSDDCSSWSHKNGSDQVVNFDFSGSPIAHPDTATWEVNQGPSEPGGSGPAFLVTYVFKAWMYVPYGKVDII